MRISLLLQHPFNMEIFKVSKIFKQTCFAKLHLLSYDWTLSVWWGRRLVNSQLVKNTFVPLYIFFFPLVIFIKAKNGNNVLCCGKDFVSSGFLRPPHFPSPSSPLQFTVPSNLSLFSPFTICVESCVLVTACLKKNTCTHINTHILFHLTQLKHSDMSGNTCALGM